MAQQLKFFLDPTSCQVINDPIEYFVNVVSAQLLKENKYYQDSDAARDDLMETMNKIADLDPEFISQTAYYVRNRMYIRTTTNFILAYAIMHPKAKQFVPKYFNKSVLIPGDLIEVCSFVQVINLLNKGISINSVADIRKTLFFPNNLKKLVASKLKQFTVYQLGKQCSESSRKKTLTKYKEFLQPHLVEEKRAKRIAKLMAMKKAIDNQGQDVKEQFHENLKERTGKKSKHSKAHQQKGVAQPTNVFDVKFLTLKDIIRFCHITEPREVVMSVMGKKYPSNEEDFKKTFVANDQNQFQLERAGKRMQVPVPPTWDRVLSSKTNSKKVAWTNLVLQNQVPYMAMIRNLRNLLQAELEPSLYYDKVFKAISDPKKVENGKMFPLQYINALSEIDKLGEPPQSSVKKTKKKQMEIEKKEPTKIYIEPSLIEAAKNSIEKALQISVDKNLDTISGVTYVFVDVSGSMGAQISGGKRYGSIATCMDCAFTLGLMIKSKCEQCQFYLFAAPGQKSNGKCFVKVEVDTGDILSGVKICRQESQRLSGSHEMVGQTIKDVLLTPKQKADTVVILSDMMVTQGFQENKGEKFQNVIITYLKNVNKNTKFYFMDISGQGQQVNFGDQLKGKNCFTITGMSDQVLKFIALNGQLDQVQDIRNFSSQLKNPVVVKNDAQLQQQQVMEQEPIQEEKKVQE